MVTHTRSLQATTFEYINMRYYVVAFYKDIVYGVDMTTKKLYKSVDGGKTWGNSLTTLADTCYNGWLTSAGDLVLFLYNGDVYHSNDDVTFTKTLTSSVAPHNSGAGIAGHAQKIMFCEYTVTSDIDIHVHYSSDGGVNWSIVMTKHTGTDIRHFHSCDYIVERDRWIVTSGDADAEVFWWISADDGANWTEKAKGHQMFRTLGVDMTGQESYLWGSDSSNYHNIYAVNGRNTEEFTQNMASPHVYNVATLDAECYSLAGHKDVHVACQKIEAASAGGVYSSSVIVTHDRGATWHKEFTVYTDDDSGGIIGVVGPDRYGRFYLYLLTAKGYASNSCVQMVPKVDVNIPKLPISCEYMQVPYEDTPISALALRDTNSHYATALPETVYDPVLVVTNKTNDDNVKVVIGVSSMVTGATGWLYNYTDDAAAGKVFGNGKTYILGSNDFAMRKTLPRGALIGVASTTASGATTGTVTVKIYGWVLRPKDFRQSSVY